MTPDPKPLLTPTPEFLEWFNERFGPRYVEEDMSCELAWLAWQAAMKSRPHSGQPPTGVREAEPVAWMGRLSDGNYVFGVHKSDVSKWNAYEVEALYPAPVTTGWRPIEEAPRDGTRILVANLFEDDTCEMAFASWYKGNDGFGRPMEGWVTDSDAADELGPAASDWDYYMPRPPPPSEDKP